jgi:hypothetical protein
MKTCSLCEAELPPEGGAVLFADSQAIPFEVCGTCEEKIELLRNARDLEATGRALKYISEYANTLENRDTFRALMNYLKDMGREEPDGAEEIVENVQAEEDPGSEDLESKRKGGGKKTIFIVAALAAILILAYAMGAFSF